MFRCVLSLLLIVFSTSIFATTSFVVKRIEVRGLQRVSRATVIAAIPLQPGQTYTNAQSNKIIAALFKTGFFDNVQLTRDDNTLIVQVTERPTIASVSITGNTSIKAKLLQPVLTKLNIVPGDTFDPSKLHAIVEGLRQQYLLLGHANVVITPEVKKISRNRVDIHIAVQEGTALIVRKISITGNSVFSEKKLVDQFQLTTPSVFTWFNHHDRYSTIQLDADLVNLRNFYLDHGYLDFHVVSHQTTHLTNGVAISVDVSEGTVYHLSGYHFSASEVPVDLVSKVTTILSQYKTGAVFSRKQIIAVGKQLGDTLADNGYAFAQINPIPQLNQATHEVFLNYQISAGNRVYVKKINIVGDTRTSGLVVRSQLRQMEGSLYSLKDINESKRRIRNLGYLDQVTVSTKPVPDKNNQVDLDYHVHEVNAGRASLQAGYSDVNGFLYGASVSEPNFMGTGRYTSIGFQRSAYASTYGFNYSNPFYTVSGISQSYSVYYTNTTPQNVNLEPYTMDTYGASTSYGIPISEYDSFNIGGGYDHTAIGNNNPSSLSPSITQFLAKYPSPYNQFKITSGISHATLDRAIFPKSGNTQSIDITAGVPALNSSLPYYQAVYSGRWYYPLWHSNFILDPYATLGYGGGYGKTDELPFFYNFYAGGLTTLPGYEPNTLGPKSPMNADQALGGNLETLGGINLILPDFISSKVRTAVLLDAGNVFETNRVAGVSYESIRPQNLRVTTGIMVSWWSPLGAPLDFSLAVPLNKKPGDELSLFNFSFGAAI